MKHVFINGNWEAGTGEERIIENPATWQSIATVRDADNEQVNRAVTSAKNAFQETSWADDPIFRSNVLRKASDLLLERTKDFAEIETANTGKPLREATIDVEDTAACLRYYAYLIPDALKDTKQMSDGTTSDIVNVPIGPCGLIVPWNFPLLLGIWKIAPALAAGNTVVYKPSELTPLSILKFAEILKEAGLPDGVFNLVLGDGKVGCAIVEHEDIKKVSFTGSVNTGKVIYNACATSLKRVSLELGGKSPFIVCDDVDIDRAADYAIFASMFNQGEVCVAAPRILVQSTIYESFKNSLISKLERLRVGNPLSPSTDMGPLISKNHIEQVEKYIEIGKNDGASLIYGGERAYETGNYLTPAVFENVTQEMRIVQEEIFGPVITLQSFSNDKEAIDLANSTEYGLAAGLLTENQERAQSITTKLDAGIVWVNSYHTPYVEAPWGGMKASGIGRELGIQGLLGFTEYKHVNYSDNIEPLDWYSFEE